MIFVDRSGVYSYCCESQPLATICNYQLPRHCPFCREPNPVDTDGNTATTRRGKVVTETKPSEAVGNETTCPTRFRYGEAFLPGRRTNANIPHWRASMKAPSSGLLVRQNVRRAKQLYPTLAVTELKALTELTHTLQLSVTRGELLCLQGKWYVSHAGLLRIGLRRRCAGIRTALQERQSDPVAGRWVFKATVYKSTGSCGFGGYGDADPTNVSQAVRGAEMRVARPRPLTGRCEKRTASEYARSRNWDHFPARGRQHRR